jgi:PAS domain S-box-containing protein
LSGPEKGALTPHAPAAGPPVADLYHAVIDSLPNVTVFVVDTDLRFTLIGGAAVSRHGWRPYELIGLRPSAILGEEEAAPLERHLRAALGGETRYHEHTGVRVPDTRWFSTIGPLRNDAEEIVGAVVVAKDVGDLRRAEEDLRRLERAAVSSARSVEFERWQRERLEFLTEINDVLSACLTRRDVMEAATRTAVPRLGDWCSIHVFLEPNDPEPVVEVAHVDPAMVAYAKDLLQRFPYDPHAPVGLAEVIRTGRPGFYPRIGEELLDAAEIPPEAARAVRELSITSAMAVPLARRGRVVGAMQFVISGSRPQYTRDDLTLAQAVAGRVAASLENHRLAERQLFIAQTLQRSLLPETLPDVPRADIAVRYWAAGEGSEVGGDFYDVFAIDDDTHAVVIGDVCGNGPQAAAVTALARHNIRASAWRGDTPAEVLASLNSALIRTWPDTLCTVAYATVAATTAGLRLNLALAGHPLPMVVRAGNAAATLGTPGLLLGSFADARYAATPVELEPGDTVVFYTDGATDLRPPWALSGDDLSVLLEQSVRAADGAEAAASNISERLQTHRAFTERNDDIALVVLCVLPQSDAG